RSLMERMIGNIFWLTPSFVHSSFFSDESSFSLFLCVSLSLVLFFSCRIS
ncbi:hypothetical protein CSUI_006830, partial [Cystoisospora suis]